MGSGYPVSFLRLKRRGLGVEPPPHMAPNLNKDYSYTSSTFLRLRGMLGKDLLDILIRGVISCSPCVYTGCNRRNGPDFGRVFLRSYYTDITQTHISKVQWLRRYWPEKFETLTAITHLLITKYILKLAGICGFCSVNICT